MTLRLDLQLQRPSFTLQLATTLASSGVTAIYGASGAGKTSLLRCIAGLERGTGSVHFGDHCWQNNQQFCPSYQRNVGFVFQDARLLPHLTVAGNLAFAAKRRFGHNGIEQAAIIDALNLHDLLPQAANTLSAGQQQRVAIARALVSQPRLLLMDEPLANLDQTSRQHILPLLEQLIHTLAIPVLYVSHQLEEVCQLASQMLLLDQGQLLAQGATAELLGRLDLPLSHQENAASIVTSRVIGHDESYQLTQLATLDDQQLWVTRLDTAIGSELQLRIPARDVSLALTDAEDSSILNRLRVRIVHIEHSHSSRVLVKLQLGSQYLLARLTQKSIDRLQLKAGQIVYAQVKTVALLNEF